MNVSKLCPKTLSVHVRVLTEPLKHDVMVLTTFQHPIVHHHETTTPRSRLSSMSGNTNTDILLAGAIAAFTVDLLVYPLDALKTRVQYSDYTRLYTNAETKIVNKPALFRGLYQGVGSVIIAALPSSGAFFTTYKRTKSLLTHINPATSSSPNGLIPLSILHAAASSTAELVSCAILTPAEVIKQNAQMVDTTPSSTSSALAPKDQCDPANPRQIPLQPRSPSGAATPHSQDVIYPSQPCQFPIFERLKEATKAHRERKGVRNRERWQKAGWLRR